MVRPLLDSVYQKIRHVYNQNLYRFDTVPEAGKSKGLVLVLDAHSDLVTSSSIPDYFQATIVFSSFNYSVTLEKDDYFRDLKPSLTPGKIIP